VRLNPELVELEREIQESLLADPPAAKIAKRRLRSRRQTLKRLALRQYQEAWLADRRDWKILTRGKEQPRDVCKTDLVRNLCLLVPERGRLAQ
jgi:hypothetical protein